jgi:hypothetical protein
MVMLQHAYFVALKTKSKEGGLKFRRIRKIMRLRPQLGGSLVTITKITTRRIARSYNQDPN